MHKNESMCFTRTSHKKLKSQKKFTLKFFRNCSHERWMLYMKKKLA